MKKFNMGKQMVKKLNIDAIQIKSFITSETTQSTLRGGTEIAGATKYAPPCPAISGPCPTLELQC